MRKITILLLFALSLSVQAQTNQGKVSVKQSAEIDELVYGKKQQVVEKTKEQLKAERKAAKKAEKEARKRAKEEEKRRKEAEKKGLTVTPAPKPVPEPVVVETPKFPEQKVAKLENDKSEAITRPQTKLVRRKVPRINRQPKSVVYKGMKKTAGYRVQVFLGGNTREDRQQAEQAGHKVKAAYPTQPVYTHFHSPQWYCRVGNFVDYKKAEAFRNNLRRQGFANASVVKCMITVRNVEKYNY